MNDPGSPGQHAVPNQELLSPSQQGCSPEARRQGSTHKHYSTPDYHGNMVAACCHQVRNAVILICFDTVLPIPKGQLLGDQHNLESLWKMDQLNRHQSACKFTSIKPYDVDDNHNDYSKSITDSYGYQFDIDSSCSGI